MVMCVCVYSLHILYTVYTFSLIVTIEYYSHRSPCLSLTLHVSYFQHGWKLDLEMKFNGASCQTLKCPAVQTAASNPLTPLMFPKPLQLRDSSTFISLSVISHQTDRTTNLDVKHSGVESIIKFDDWI